MQYLPGVRPAGLLSQFACDDCADWKSATSANGSRGLNLMLQAMQAMDMDHAYYYSKYMLVEPFPRSQLPTS